jgi:hypothetical protein
MNGGALTYRRWRLACRRLIFAVAMTGRAALDLSSLSAICYIVPPLRRSAGGPRR